jgi:multidrug efflux pump subunit AcrB
LSLVLLFGGIISFNSLARLEDPEFTIKEAIIVTPYPGASAEEVEEEVTNVMELAAQELGQVWWVESKSQRNLSMVKLRFKDEYHKRSLPQVLDELRRKVNDYQVRLPPGAGPSVVNDDYGNVYGVFLALTGEGYTYSVRSACGGPGEARKRRATRRTTCRGAGGKDKRKGHRS